MLGLGRAGFPRGSRSRLGPFALVRVTGMQHEFREGDWVRHHSCAVPIRVIGTGATIAVQFPSGVMRAFEPCELERVSIAAIPQPKLRLPERRPDRELGTAERFASLATSVGLICLIVLVLAVIAGARPWTVRSVLMRPVGKREHSAK
jgi:hypothetical protein